MMYQYTNNIPIPATREKIKSSSLLLLKLSWSKLQHDNLNIDAIDDDEGGGRAFKTYTCGDVHHGILARIPIKILMGFCA